MQVARVPRCVRIIIRWCDVLTMCLGTRSQVEHPDSCYEGSNCPGGKLLRLFQALYLFSVYKC